MFPHVQLCLHRSRSPAEGSFPASHLWDCRVSLGWAPRAWAASQGWRCFCSAAPGPLHAPGFNLATSMQAETARL